MSAVAFLPVLGCMAMMVACAAMMWRHSTRAGTKSSPEQDGSQ
jgi:hypothetical protein